MASQHPWLALGAFGAFALAAAAGCSGPAAVDTGDVPAVGGTAPDIVGVDLDGVSFKLSDYKGKVVFLDFWGDW
ncbi:MAG: hypothetical protein KDE27_25255 [Planctomycetes bacterium]|nr:hypothetical protein [Planctomycetota bacterium]